MKLWHAKYATVLPSGLVKVDEEDYYLPTMNDVRRQLRTHGHWPIRIEQRRKPLLEWMDVRTRAWQLQLLRALRFQTTTTSAGTALLNIIENESDARRRVAFLPTRTVLKGGGAFASALKELHLFDAATLAIILAGERGGDLKGVINHAIQHIEEKGHQIKAFTGALGWLMFDIISVIGSLWGAQYGFIPYLRDAGIKSEDAAAVEKFTKSLNMAATVNGCLMWLSTLVSIGAAWVVYSFWMNRHKTDHLAARIMTRVPFFSAYLQNSSFHDTGKLMARLLRGRVPLDESIQILVGSSVEPSVRDYWSGCHRRIMAGADPMRAMARHPLNKAERDHMAKIQSVDQLAEVFEAIATERQLAAKDDQRRIILMGIMALVFLFTAVVLTMIYLLTLQNQGLNESLKGMRGGT